VAAIIRAGHCGNQSIQADRRDRGKRDISPPPSNPAQQDLSMEILREATLMLQLNHPYILNILGLSFHDGSAMIILEFMTHGSMEHFLLAHKRSLVV
jgi:serine/threonine protein kinase